MGRLSLSQLRYRAGRSLALLLGMLIATTAFTVLTAASRTSQLRAVGTVSEHFRTAYDILVRPAGSRTALESRTGTVSLLVTRKTSCRKPSPMHSDRWRTFTTSRPSVRG